MLVEIFIKGLDLFNIIKVLFKQQQLQPEPHKRFTDMNVHEVIQT
jgi:hypothetical protein